MKWVLFMSHRMRVQRFIDGIYYHSQVLSSDNPNYGYNAGTGNYEDLMAAGIIDPTKVSILKS